MSTDWEEELATLEAALAFIDGYENSNELSSSDEGSDESCGRTKNLTKYTFANGDGSRSPFLPPLPTFCNLDEDIVLDNKRKRLRSVKNKARERQKWELIRLRSESNDLEKLLHHLQRRRAATMADDDRFTSIETASLPPATLPHDLMWKDIAEFQYRLRQISEAENAMLREKIASQLSATKKLNRSVQQYIRDMTSPSNSNMFGSYAFIIVSFFFFRRYRSNSA